MNKLNKIIEPLANRIPIKDCLFDRLPLSVPYSVHIDPTNKCNFKCFFCPTGNQSLLESVGRPAGMMSVKFFKNVVSSIKLLCDEKGEKIRRLHLYKDGEPFLNKNLEDMIRFSVDMGISESVETTTNGSVLTKDRALKVIDSGLDLIRVSVEHVNDEGYRGITKVFSDYNKILGNVGFLYSEKNRLSSQLHVHAKIIGVNLSEDEKNKFIDDFSGITDSIDIDGRLMGWSGSFNKKIDMDVSVIGDDGGSLKREKIVCPSPFSSLLINYDGTVSTCCVDWSCGTIVGDINSESFIDIWEGDRLREFRLMHLNGDRSNIKVCSDCDYVNGFSDLTNLDCNIDDLLLLYND
jgi:radical SAM protein with 4Fe4S-binding SPASM domain